MSVDNEISNDANTLDSAVTPVKNAAVGAFDKVKSSVFWFAAGFAVSMFMSRRRKNNAS